MIAANNEARSTPFAVHELMVIALYDSETTYAKKAGLKTRLYVRSSRTHVGAGLQTRPTRTKAGYDVARTYLLNQAIVRFQASSAAALL